MKFSEIRNKQVIDMGGNLIGRVQDLRINTAQGQIETFEVAKDNYFFLEWFYCFFPRSCISITMIQIVSIGDDVILVNIK